VVAAVAGVVVVLCVQPAKSADANRRQQIIPMSASRVGVSDAVIKSQFLKLTIHVSFIRIVIKNFVYFIGKATRKCYLFQSK
jgi:hypothetical protein